MTGAEYSKPTIKKSYASSKRNNETFLTILQHHSGMKRVPSDFPLKRMDTLIMLPKGRTSWSVSLNPIVKIYGK